MFVDNVVEVIQPPPPTLESLHYLRSRPMIFLARDRAELTTN